MRSGLVAALGLLAACGTKPIIFDPVVEGGIEAAPPPPGMGCASDSDCPLQTHCDVGSGQCFECVQSAQCAPNVDRPVCYTTMNLCVECNKDSDCRGGDKCESHRCIPSCGDAGSCPPYEFCNRSTETCVQCTDSTECMMVSRTVRYCDTTVGRCVQCLDNGYCPPEAPICDRTTGGCVECLNNQGCLPPQACDPIMHYCVDLDGGTRGFADASFDGPFR